MKRSIVLIYNSYRDPLFQGNLFKHLEYEASNSRFKFLLISFEQEKYVLNKKEQEQEIEKLRKLNIKWVPLKWHSNRFILIKKGYDLFFAFFIILFYRISDSFSSIITLGTIAGSFGFIISQLLSLKHYAYQHEPHSEFMKDFGIWQERSLSYKLLNFFEKKTAKHAHVIATGTDAMLIEIKQVNLYGDVLKIPSCVDEKLFIIDSKAREKIRSFYKIPSDATTVIYVGKFGGIYYDEEIFTLFKLLKESLTKAFFIILSPDNKELILEKVRKKNIEEKDILITECKHEKVYQYLNASDIGVVAVPGLPSQKYRSPIKVGEYLCCGLPYIVCEGVSEDDFIARKYQVGVVLENFENLEIENHIKSIKDLIKRNKNKEYLRTIGIAYRGLSGLKKTIREAFNRLYEVS